MSYGLKVFGNSSNAILDHEHPVMRLIHKGDLIVNSLRPLSGAASVHRHGWGHCTIYYPETYRQLSPPMVFGAPNGSMANDVSVGLFTHLGSPGEWTGFRIFFEGSLGRKFSNGGTSGYHQGGKAVYIGTDTGWSYYVCTAEPGTFGADPFGLRLFSEAGTPVYDSSWPIVPFRRLLTNWSYISWPGSPYTDTSYLAIQPSLHSWEWGQPYEYDHVEEFYAHPWGYADGTLGILLSSLSGVAQRVRYASVRNIVTVPFIGFRGNDRSRIICCLQFGYARNGHATGGEALDGWGLLTADMRLT